MRVVIIGGGAAGASCATRLRRLDELADIVILEKSEENSVATCGLPYYIGDVIDDDKNLRIASPVLFKKLFNIDVRLNTEVVAIQAKQKTVLTADGETFVYDKLVIACGTQIYIPPLKGLNNVPCFKVKSISDSNEIKEYIKKNNITNAAIVGGGFVGVEIAENLKNKGIDVALIEKSSQILSAFDDDMIGQLHDYLRNNGIDLYLKSIIKEIEKNKIVLETGEKIEAQMLIFASGNYPQTQIAARCGIDMTKGGEIKVNEYMQTNINSVYACGDIVAFKDKLLNDWKSVALAGPANKQGRIIADHIAGKAYPYRGSMGAGVIKVFDKTAAFVGYKEKILRECGVSYEKMIIWGSAKASYYDKKSDAALKIIYDKNGLILGAQAVGFGSVEKYIDIVSALMQTGGTITDLRDLEHCYAPPYAAVKSLLNIAGAAIENIRQKYFKTYFGKNFSDMFILDVRSEKMYAKGHIKGAVNIPAGQIRDRLKEIPEDKTILVYCVKGHNSYTVARILLQNGYNNVLSYAGGWLQYEAQIKG